MATRKTRDQIAQEVGISAGSISSILKLISPMCRNVFNSNFKYKCEEKLIDYDNNESNTNNISSMIHKTGLS